ncbi:MAG TPA: DNA-formamidopyrimidine glycosylase [Candidatus Pacearchaeota archaeon]|nr:DNA-formamidopyrimidine glycosylase [Candidatus Pacearchaeota archaeon]HOK93948.1 DNA-formamidopyrimidine glycosylase [Candidatus Pacearchaeota archaeon]HPO75019.1 DNA-formamidopyrimidine glycosylase [Candidatus Pacearchaeota archaeon]
MPELPEVETIVRELNKTKPPIIGVGFFDVWTDNPKMIKKPKDFEQFKKIIKGKKIQKIWRRGKNIIFDLSENYSLLIHQKLTGHLLFGKWEFKNGFWKTKTKGPLEDKINSYIHLLFTLDNDWMLALSDLRKFAKVELWESDQLINSKEFKNLGPEPLEEAFTFEKFKEVIQKTQGKIKQVLMDQTIIAGIGNIYSDEILWEAKINPFKKVNQLNDKELKRIYQAMKKILKKAVEAGGESISDFRRISGEKGGFDPLRKVYRREGQSCFRCGAIIKRVQIRSRSAHFCPKCQSLE